MQTQTIGSYEIVSIRMRGNGGRWGMAHQVWSNESGALLGTFGKLAAAKRFIAGLGV